MNIVLYTDDLEPITVIRLPYTRAQITALDLHHIKVAVLGPVQATDLPSPIPTKYDGPKIVGITVEKLFRKGVEHYMFTTSDEEAALMLNSEPLPGHRRMLQEEFQKGFGRGILSALDQIYRD